MTRIINFREGGFALPILQEFYDRICDRGINRQDVTGLFVRLLTDYFKNPDNIKYEELKGRVWTPGEDTGILIESIGRFRPELAEKRPAILVRPGEWKKVIQGLQGDMIIEGPYQHERVYVLEVQGGHNIISVSKNPVETELLADEVFKFLDMLKAVLPAMTPIAFFRVVGISDLKALPESKTHFCCVIPVVYHVSQRYNITLELSD